MRNLSTKPLPPSHQIVGETDDGRRLGYGSLHTNGANFLLAGLHVDGDLRPDAIAQRLDADLAQDVVRAVGQPEVHPLGPLELEVLVMPDEGHGSMLPAPRRRGLARR